MSEKVFTIEEAQEHISWLSNEIESIIPKRNSIRELQRQIDELVSRMAGNGGQNSHNKLEEFQKELNKVSQDIKKVLSAISKRGILIKGIDPFLVDFPHKMDARLVYLCWTEGETSIKFWHEIDIGFQGRQTL